MTDKELIDLIANTWIKNGGDCDGFDWCWKEIRATIEELEKNNDRENYINEEKISDNLC